MIENHPMNTVYELTTIKQCTYYKFSNFEETHMDGTHIHAQTIRQFISFDNMYNYCSYVHSSIVFHMDLQAIYH